MRFFSSFFDDRCIELTYLSVKIFFVSYFPGVVLIPDTLMNCMEIEASENFELIVVAEDNLFVEGANHNEIFYIFLL